MTSVSGCLISEWASSDRNTILETCWGVKPKWLTYLKASKAEGSVKPWWQPNQWAYFWLLFFCPNFFAPKLAQKISWRGPPNPPTVGTYLYIYVHNIYVHTYIMFISKQVCIHTKNEKMYFRHDMWNCVSLMKMPEKWCENSHDPHPRTQNKPIPPILLPPSHVV